MIETVFIQNATKTVRQTKLCDTFVSEHLNITVNRIPFFVKLDGNNFYYLISEKIDIPVNAKILIESEDNVISFSKSEFEYDKVHELEQFNGYLKIRVENVDVATFTPFKLKFLKNIAMRNE